MMFNLTSLDTYLAMLDYLHGHLTFARLPHRLRPLDFGGHGYPAELFTERPAHIRRQNSDTDRGPSWATNPCPHWGKSARLHVPYGRSHISSIQAQYRHTI
jgi:hypothetical protein